MKEKNVVLIGQSTKSYLTAASNHLKRCGFFCNISPDESAEGGATLILQIRDFRELDFTLNCRCLEINLNDTWAEIMKTESLIKDAEHVIVVFPLKLFPAFRYNMDDDLTEIAGWVTPDMLRHIVCQVARCKGISFSWVITGADYSVYSIEERPSRLLDTIRNVENISGLEDRISAILSEYFTEFEEKNFLEQCREDSVVSFGFLEEGGTSAMGEKTCIAWNTFGLLTAIGYKEAVERAIHRWRY